MTMSGLGPDWDYQQQVESEDRMREAVHAAYISVATSALDRMLRRADTVIKVAGTTGTIYTAIIGLAFTYGKTPFSTWVLVPAVLVALSLVLGASFVGYLQAAPTEFQPLASGLSARVQHQRLSDLLRWVNSISLKRAWTLRSSVAALGLGVAAMPIGFIDQGRANFGTVVIALAASWTMSELVMAKSRQ